MITPEDVQGVADFVGRKLTEDQIKKVIELYTTNPKQDQNVEWYLVVEEIIYALTD